jgi:uncharacterized metal-binding protein
MATGTTHGRITLYLAVITSPIALIATHSIIESVAIGLGCLIGLVIDPDLDIDHVTESERRMIKLFGPLAYLWLGLWLPYALIIPHRSFLSHMPILGTAIRLLYLAGWLYLTLYSLDMVDKALVILGSNLGVIMWLCLGLAISDIGHWIADWSMFSKVWSQ